jgi:GNAT superfamily N-acetyltransferase
VYELRVDEADAGTVQEHLRSWLASLGTERRNLVYVKIPTRAVAMGQVLTAHGFYPVETTLEIALSLPRMTPITTRKRPGIALRPAVADDLPKIMTIAQGAFWADRLHQDPNLPAEKADQRFTQWVKRGFDDGEMVFAYEDQKAGQLIGFYHVRATGPTTVDLSLAAVDRPFQQLGLGALMYQAVLEECRSRGYQVATTHISINNLDVLNLFVRLGSDVRGAVLTLHRVVAGPASS